LKNKWKLCPKYIRFKIQKEKLNTKSKLCCPEIRWGETQEGEYKTKAGVIKWPDKLIYWMI